MGETPKSTEPSRQELQEPVDPTSEQETPAEGSVVLPAGDMPPEGNQPVPNLQASPQPEAALPFERLGRYQILARIGHGGMGDVYRGYDESMDRQVAIKVLPQKLARNKDYVRRFHAEASAVARLDHPNIVRLDLIGEDAGHHFFAMELIEGESLAERLALQPRVQHDEALGMITQCLAGLEAAHAQGLIHRDVKPRNILLEHQTDRAVLVDFGLVRVLGQSARMTVTGMVVGTVDYMAPEQARGQTIDGRADIYALGVLLYRMLSGRMPFEAETPTGMVFQHAYEDPLPLEEAAPDVPQPVVEIVRRMMAKNLDDRYPDCQAVLADIEAFRADRPLAAAGESGTRKTTVLPAPDPSWEPELPEGLAELADNRRRRRIRDWAATMFRRHAPEFVKDLQSTTQQVDSAVAHYERHRDRLARLHEEARGITDELAEQLQANVEAAAAAMQEVESATGHEEEQAALAKKNECEEHVAALRKQHDEQRQQIDEIEHQLNRADAKLLQLRSRRDVLKARLKAAEARQRLEGGRPRAKRSVWVFAATLICCAIAGALFVFLLSERLGLWKRVGTLEVEGETAEVLLAVQREGDNVYRPLQLDQSGKFQLQSGNYRLILVEGADEYEVVPETIVVRAGGHTAVKIRLRAPPGQPFPNGWVIHEPVNLGPTVNSSSKDNSPALSADGLTLLFASTRGLGESDLWTCTRASLSESFGEPVNLGPTVNSSFGEGRPALSADELTLLFFSNRPGGQGDDDIWMCERASLTGPFGRPVNLGATVNSSFRDIHPTLSADGLTLYFSSGRRGGLGQRDLWMCQRASSGEPFGMPVNLGPAVNWGGTNSGPAVSADGLTLLFSSNGRPGGQGGWDLWMCTRASLTEPFGKPVNLGPSVNSSFQDHVPALSADGRTLLLISNRPGGQGGGDLWMARIEHREIPSTERVSRSASTPWQLPPDAPKPAIAPFDTDKAKEHQQEWAEHLGLPVEYTNSIGMKFRLIPLGEFLMGSPEAEQLSALEEAKDDKVPKRCIDEDSDKKVHSIRYGSQSRCTWACMR